MNEFSQILQATLTPIALISGVGLLLLVLVTRYNHAIDRIRHLVRERSERPEEETRIFSAMIHIIYRRCRVLRNAIAFVASSTVFSGAIVFSTAIEGVYGTNLIWLKGSLLLVSVGLVVVAALMFVYEVIFSLNALRIELEPEDIVPLIKSRIS